MTTIKSVEEVIFNLVENAHKHDSINILRQSIIERDLAISTALVEELEGKKIKRIDLQDCSKMTTAFTAKQCYLDEEKDSIYNQALTEAQNIIRTLLESKN